MLRAELSERRLHLREREERREEFLERQEARREEFERQQERGREDELESERLRRWEVSQDVLKSIAEELENNSGQAALLIKHIPQGELPFPAFETNGWHLIVQSPVVTSLQERTLRRLMRVYNRCRTFSGCALPSVCAARTRASTSVSRNSRLSSQQGSPSGPHSLLARKLPSAPRANGSGSIK